MTSPIGDPPPPIGLPVTEEELASLHQQIVEQGDRISIGAYSRFIGQTDTKTDQEALEVILFDLELLARRAILISQGTDEVSNLFRQARDQFDRLPDIDRQTFDYNEQQHNLAVDQSSRNADRLEAFVARISSYNDQATLFNSRLTQINDARANEIPALPPLSAMPIVSIPTVPPGESPGYQGFPEHFVQVPPPPSVATISISQVNDRVDEWNEVYNDNSQVTARWNPEINNYLAGANTLNGNLAYLATVPGLPPFTAIDASQKLLTPPGPTASSNPDGTLPPEAQPLRLYIEFDADQNLDPAKLASNEAQEDIADSELQTNMFRRVQFLSATTPYEDVRSIFNAQLGNINAQRAIDELPPYQPMPPFNQTYDNRPLLSYPNVDYDQAGGSTDEGTFGQPGIDFTTANSVRSVNEDIDAYNDRHDYNSAVVRDLNTDVTTLNGLVNNYLTFTYIDGTGATVVEDRLAYLNSNGFPATPLVTTSPLVPTPVPIGEFPPGTASQRLLHFLTFEGTLAMSSAESAPIYDADEINPANSQINEFNANLSGLYATQSTFYNNNLVAINDYLQATFGFTLGAAPLLNQLELLRTMADAVADFLADNPDQDVNDIDRSVIASVLTANGFPSNAANQAIAAYNNFAIPLNNNLAIFNSPEFQAILPQPFVFETYPVFLPIPPLSVTTPPDEFDVLSTPLGSALSRSLNSLNEQILARLRERLQEEIDESLNLVLPGRPPLPVDGGGSIDITSPGAAGLLISSAALSPVDVSELLSHGIVQDFIRLWLADIELSLGQGGLVGPAAFFSLLSSAVISINDGLSPLSTARILALAKAILGDVDLDDEGLTVLSALGDLEEVIAAVSSDLVEEVVETVLPTIPAFSGLEASRLNDIARTVSNVIEFTLLRQALAEVEVLLGNDNLVRDTLRNIINARNEANAILRDGIDAATVTDAEGGEPVEVPTQRTVEDIAREFEAPLREALDSRIQELLGERITPEIRENLVQRFVSLLFGPAPLTAPAPTGEEGETIFLDSVVELLLGKFTAIVDDVERLDEHVAEVAEEDFRESPTIRLSEDLEEFFLRMLLPNFRLERWGGIVYRNDDLALPPPIIQG